MTRRTFSAKFLAIRLYAEADAAPCRSPERAKLYRLAAIAQRQAEAAAELERVTKARRRAA